MAGDNAVNGNDAQDSDTGVPNAGQNFPELDGAYAGASDIRVTGNFNSVPNSTYKIQYFYNDVCDGSGNGEGQTLIGTQTITTDANGDASINKTFSMTVTVGSYVSALATDASNNTSEFSACQIVDLETAVNKANASAVKVYPNITRDNVSVSADKSFTYTVYDQQGREVIQGTSKSENFVISFSNLSEGLYVLKLVGNNWVSQEKIIKE